MPQKDATSDEIALLTDELLELEGEFESEIKGLRERQEAALRRLEAAVDGIKGRKGGQGTGRDDL